MRLRQIAIFPRRGKISMMTAPEELVKSLNHNGPEGIPVEISDALEQVALSFDAHTIMIPGAGPAHAVTSLPK